MIRYSLSCDNGHGFDSWFQSAAAWDSLSAQGQVTCPVCGSARVDKALMAPAVRPARAAALATGAGQDGPNATGEGSGSGSGTPAATPGARAPSDRPLSEPGNEMEQALAALRKQVEENSDYVGMNFAAEARRIHDGDAPARPIYGEARPDEARRLIEDGVPVAPLPFLPARKTN